MVSLNFDDNRLKSTPFFYFINYINVLHDNFLKENFKDITPRDFTYLSNIFYHENISQKELANLLYVSEANVAQIIKRLEKSGYVKREFLKDDHGKNLLT
ncbi:MAG: MarR family transcriptional regulator [Methanobrevibacter sp.]|nr:MarR family transcriptional regulator [Methanobrevibacter sp.]